MSALPINIPPSPVGQGTLLTFDAEASTPTRRSSSPIMDEDREMSPISNTPEQLSPPSTFVNTVVKESMSQWIEAGKKVERMLKKFPDFKAEYAACNNYGVGVYGNGTYGDAFLFANPMDQDLTFRTTCFFARLQRKKEKKSGFVPYLVIIDTLTPPKEGSKVEPAVNKTNAILFRHDLAAQKTYINDERAFSISLDEISKKKHKEKSDEKKSIEPQPASSSSSSSQPIISTPSPTSINKIPNKTWFETVKSCLNNE